MGMDQVMYADVKKSVFSVFLRKKTHGKHNRRDFSYDRCLVLWRYAPHLRTLLLSVQSQRRI